MPIDESQLKTWSNSAKTDKAKNTADSVKYALNTFNFPTNNYEVYLQGSYRNDTNIYGESDVDVVIQLNQSFFSNLNDNQKNQLGFTPATYAYDEFKRDVLMALQNHYGHSSVKVTNKCFKISSTSARLPIDVVVALQHRSYQQLEINSFVEGIEFWINNDNRRIINFPKQTYINGCQKNNDTGYMFKPMVRIFKNMREKANISGPSYFVQCLIYNVPSNLFKYSYYSSTLEILKYLSNCDENVLKNFKCQHELFDLFGFSKELWNTDEAIEFIFGVIKFWNNWDK